MIQKSTQTSYVELYSSSIQTGRASCIWPLAVKHTKGISIQKATAKGNSQLQKMFTSQKDEVIYTKMYKGHITLNKKQIHIIYTK